jgi:hypothetical protein
MAATSILLVVVVSSSVFVQDYLSRWQKRDLLAEELAFVAEELAGNIRACNSYLLFEDSCTCVMPDGTKRAYDWSQGRLVRNGMNLTRRGLSVKDIAIGRFHLNEAGNDTILDNNIAQGLYTITITVADGSGRVDSLSTTARNDYEYFKMLAR